MNQQVKQMDRRELGIALSAFAVFGSITAAAQDAAAPGEGPTLAHSELFPFDKLPVKTAPNGMATRAVLRGTLATGEYIEVHETTLPAGEMPHPPHRHTHSELLLIRDGKLEVTSDRQRGIIEAGGVIFTASAVLHGLRNIGDSTAHYFVVAVGVQKVIA